MKHFTKRNIKDGEVARQLYKTLVYPPTKDFRWAVQSHQINNFPVTVQNVDYTIKIWGKELDEFKVDTTQSKPNKLSRNQMKVTIEILKLHREVFLTADIFFVNKIPFFLTVSRKLCFTAANHLTNRKVP